MPGEPTESATGTAAPPMPAPAKPDADPTPEEAKGAVRFNVAFPRKVWDALVTMSNDQDVSKTEVLRRALSTERFLRRRIKDGGKVLVEDKHGNIERIVFSYWGDE